ncbi:MAG: hypothetical protein GY929_12310 [Actinomycetia bacterium]|nr:hypothetical protein [Actinomycetes bacterium]
MSAAPSRKAPTTPGPRPEAEPSRRSQLRIVERVRSVQRPLLIGTLMVVVTGALFALAALNAVLVAGQAELDAVNNQIELTARQEAQLRVQVAELSAPEQIIARAEALGMTRAAPPVHLPAVEGPLGPPPAPPATVPAGPQPPGDAAQAESVEESAGDGS